MLLPGTYVHSPSVSIPPSGAGLISILARSTICNGILVPWADLFSVALALWTVSSVRVGSSGASHPVSSTLCLWCSVDDFATAPLLTGEKPMPREKGIKALQSDQVTS